MTDSREGAGDASGFPNPSSSEAVPGGPSGPDDPPPLSEFVERTPSRLALEAVLGAGAGFLVGPLLFPEAGGALPFAVAGAILAPMSLLLTPLAGGIMYRAFRYGIALAVLVTLAVSFMVGAEVLPVDELLVIALFVFAVGAVGHGIVAAVVDREPASVD